MTPKRRVIVIVLVVLLAAAGLMTWRWLDGADSRLASAVALAPAGTERLSWTDWSEVRTDLDDDLTDATGEDLESFLDTGFEADLTSTSGIVTSSPTLHEKYGVSPANLEWELIAQAPGGQVILLGLPDDVVLDDLRDTLRGLGYVAPDEEGGTWTASETVLAGLGELTPELAHLRIDADDHLLVASEDPTFLAGWREDPRDTGVDDGIGDVVAAYDDARAVSALMYSGDHACSSLAMSQADGADVARADQLVADAGEVHPLRGFAMATLPGGDVRVTMAFETDDQARTDADSRAVLASGPAPGQGGDFSDRFTLGEVSADGSIVRMELEPVTGAYVVSDLSTGPVLFATC